MRSLSDPKTAENYNFMAQFHRCCKVTCHFAVSHFSVSISVSLDGNVTLTLTLTLTLSLTQTLTLGNGKRRSGKTRNEVM